jgi:tetratricopeptide (TPR) repeat protein
LIVRADSDSTSEDSLGVVSEDVYRDLVVDAIREYDLHHFAEARGLFSKAHAISPSARTLRGLGAAEFELRNYGASVSYLEQALASQARPLEGELRERTNRLLERARGFVATLELRVQPESSLAVVDGVPVRDQHALVLDVGDHVLEFHAPGYVPEKRKMHVVGGEVQQLQVVLTLRVERVGPVAQERPTKQPLYRNAWLWTGLGLLVVGAAVGTALAFSGPRYDGGSEERVLHP